MKEFGKTDERLDDFWINIEGLKEFWIDMERYWTKFERYWKILTSFREIEGKWDRYREIRRTLVRLTRFWMNLGKVVRV